MINLTQKTYSEINKDLAARLAKIRKRKKISQQELSIRSGVSYASLRRFENSGEISLASLAKLAIALDLDDELDNLFTHVPFDSIEEIIRGQD